MIMPHGLTGTELAQRLSVARPHMKVILTSGYNREALRGQATAATGMRFLQKPFDAAKLLLTVREVLDEPEAGPEARPGSV